jgi:RNA polymerase sigma-70 factor (ECF subfamily)
MTFDLGRELVTLLPRLRRLALALCRSADEADDLVQATCERALASADRFTPGTRLDSWLFRILRNLWLDGARRRATRGTEIDVDDAVDLADGTGGRAGEDRLYLGEVWALVHALPPEQREVLVLVCVEDLSYREAAAVLDVPVGTVMSRLARARKKIADATEAVPAAERSRSARRNGG